MFWREIVHNLMYLSSQFFGFIKLELDYIKCLTRLEKNTTQPSRGGGPFRLGRNKYLAFIPNTKTTSTICNYIFSV